MDLLSTVKAKVEEIGIDQVCSTLGITPDSLKKVLYGKRLDLAQKVFDIWGQNPDKEAVEMSWDADGAWNASYTPPEWGNKKKAWDGRDICLCLPTYNNVPDSSFFCFMALVAKYRMGLRIEHRGNDSMIARSRNQLAKRFLKTDATWSIWLDSDMIFPFGNAGTFITQTGMNYLPTKFAGVMTLERLIGWGKTVVGGCYWDRRGSGRLIAGGSTPILAPIPSDVLQPVAFVGTGCLAVHRKVFEDVALKFPETMHEDSMGNETGFFTPIQTNSRMLGEDESFAKRATDAGHPSYLDLGIICGHVGTIIHGLPKTGSRI